MKNILLFIFTILFYSNLLANDDKNKLVIQQDDKVVTVLNFKEGDTLKLYEQVSNLHVLTSVSNKIDLSNLPVNNYYLVDHLGRKANLSNGVVNISEEEKYNNSESEKNENVNNNWTVAKVPELLGVNYNGNLKIKKDNNFIEVLDFKEGENLKLFELNGFVHVLTKSRKVIDFSQLNSGKYLLENSDTGNNILIEYAYNQ